MQFKVHFLLSLSEQNVLSDYGVRLCSPDASWHIDDHVRLHLKFDNEESQYGTFFLFCLYCDTFVLSHICSPSGR